MTCAGWPLLLAAATLAAAPSARGASCSKSLSDLWKEDISENETAFIVENKRGSSAADASSTSLFMYCFAKGPHESGLEILDPFVETKLQRSMFWLFSKKACEFMEDMMGIGVEDSATCGYPTPAAGLTINPERSPDGLQNSWYGPLLSIPQLNGEDLSDSSLDAQDVITHGTINGVDGASSCTAEEEEESRTWYDGGVQGVITRGSYLTYRAFMFKRAEDRNKAMAIASDSVNPGLQYAFVVNGSHGCDLEVVLEIKPKVGGGVDLSASLPLESLTIEREEAVRASIKVYRTDGEIVVLVGKKEMRDAQNLPSEGYAGDQDLLRFSRTFVCKSTGGRVEADIAFHLSNGSVVRNFPLNATDAIAFQADPGSPGTASFSLSLSPSQAPESCITMYWDPLMSAVSGDGIPWRPGGLNILVIVLIVVGSCCCCGCCVAALVRLLMVRRQQRNKDDTVQALPLGVVEDTE